MAHTSARLVLAFLGGFVALTAIPSAFLVVPSLPRELLLRGPFVDFTIPAIALGIVGVVAAAAAVGALLRPGLAAVTSVLAGLAIICFELVQIGVVGLAVVTYGPQHPQSWLQIVYLAAGVTQVIVAYRLWRPRRPMPIVPAWRS